jgi:glutaredoxin 3
VTVTIYTKPGCPYCAAAKEDLSRRGIEYEEVDVYATPGAREKVAELTGGQRVVPVLVDERDEVHIGFGGG